MKNKLLILLLGIFTAFSVVAAPTKTIPDGPALPGFIPGFKVDYSKPSTAKNLKWVSLVVVVVVMEQYRMFWQLLTI